MKQTLQMRQEEPNTGQHFRSRVAHSGNTHFVDNRPEMLAQRKIIQSMAKARAPVTQLVPGGAAPVQLLTQGTVYKTSENAHYRTRISDSNYVGVKSFATAPSPAGWITSTGTITSSFHEYQFTGAFQNDCLQFAKQLGYEIKGAVLGPTKRLKAVIGGMPSAVSFGIKAVSGGKASHTALADGDHGAFALDEHASPSVGQSYTTVPKSAHVVTGCKFHVATVVARDGNDAVTCEADAGDHGRTEPVFDMYSTLPASLCTFHATFANDYGGVYAVTGVLQPE